MLILMVLLIAACVFLQHVEASYIQGVANALFHVYVGVGDYTLPLDHSVLVRSDICHLGYHGDTWD